MGDNRVFGDPATKLLFENDRVKVWELALEPGGTSDLHEHHHDYVLIQLEGDVAYGNVFYTGKGGVETAKNTGNKPYREILVELKD